MLLPVLFGCSRKGADNVKQMSYVVSDSLLGSAYDVPRADLIVRPPLGFEAIPDSLLAAMRGRFEQERQESPGDSIHLDQFYFDTAHKAALFVATVDGLTLQSDTGAFVAPFRLDLTQQFGADSVLSQDYRIGDVYIKDIVAQDAATVRRSLLCFAPDGDAAELQFIIPRVYYAEMKKSIESTIGSLSLTPGTR